MKDIVSRLRGSLKFDAVNGEPFERDICAQQMLEAANEIDRLLLERERGVEVGIEESIADNGGLCCTVVYIDEAGVKCDWLRPCSAILIPLEDTP